MSESLIKNLGSLPLTAEDDDQNLEGRLAVLDQQIQDMPENPDPAMKGLLYLDKAEALIALKREADAWEFARAALDLFLNVSDWENAARACDLLFATEQEQSLPALGQAIWLAVTFPMDMNLTVSLLQHVVDETPDDSDGAAVAAATAVYLVDLRCQDDEHKSLSFFANQLLGSVARRHSQIDSQDDFNAWIQKLELDQPEKLFPRLRNVVDVLVQNDWWFDRDALQAQIPDN